jgi:dipeptidyl aminopeptidase/acylaminoacyl peptidase
MKKRKAIRFLQWSALSLAVVALATYAIDRATGFHLFFALQSFPFCDSVQQVVPSPTGHATAYVLATGFVDSSTGIRVRKRFQMFPRGVLSHSVSETTVSELRKVQTEKDYGKLEWSPDGTILAYSRGGIFVAAYDFNAEEQIALGVSTSRLSVVRNGQAQRIVRYKKPKTADEFTELDRRIREAIAGRTKT